MYAENLTSDHLCAFWFGIREESGPNGLRIHDCRQIRATQRVMDGVVYTAVGRLLGYCQRETAAHYAHTNDAALTVHFTAISGEASRDGKLSTKAMNSSSSCASIAMPDYSFSSRERRKAELTTTDSFSIRFIAYGFNPRHRLRRLAQSHVSPAQHLAINRQLRYSRAARFSPRVCGAISRAFLLPLRPNWLAPFLSTACSEKARCDQPESLPCFPSRHWTTLDSVDR